MPLKSQQEGSISGRTYSLSLTSNFWMKSLASSEISLKASSSKSYLATVTLAIVSMSVSPMNGESPDRLERDGHVFNVDALIFII